MSMSARALLFANIVLLWPPLLPAQHPPPTTHKVEAFAERARSERKVGKEVPVSDRIFNEMMAEAPTDYPPCNRENRNSFEAHQILLRPNLLGGLAILGGGGCFCSVTGNCRFWIYQLKNGTYRPVLETYGVQLFGFLKSRTHGYPDLVVWTHMSAARHEVRLFRFDGDQYIASGGWTEDYEYLDDHDQVVRPDKPRITSHFSSRDQIPGEVKP